MSISVIGKSLKVLRTKNNEIYFLIVVSNLKNVILVIPLRFCFDFVNCDSA